MPTLYEYESVLTSVRVRVVHIILPKISPYVLATIYEVYYSTKPPLCQGVRCIYFIYLENF